MKKLIVTLSIFACSLCSFGQKFYTVDAQVVTSSIRPYERIIGDSAVVDSVSMQINCWFGQVNNPYVDTLSHQWCAFNQITSIIKGNPKSSYYLNVSKKFCEAYRKSKYPNIGQ